MTSRCPVNCSLDVDYCDMQGHILDEDKLHPTLSNVRVVVIEEDKPSFREFVVQSQNEANFMTDVTPATTESSQNVEFVDENEGTFKLYPSVKDNLSLHDKMRNIELSNFLSRPVKINEFTWSESQTTIGANLQSIKPWQLYFSDTVIQNKLKNYAYLRCDLRVKVVINASPFYYGALMMAYRPLDQFIANETITLDPYGARHLIPYSQRPHEWIFPQHNEGGNMMLPFFYPYNWIQVGINQEFTAMGQLDFLLFAPLESANGVTSASLNISTYAWAENVELSGPTIGLTMQSADEYGKRPASTIATAIADTAKVLTRIPIIAPFATATEFAMRGIGNALRILGFSNPNVIDAVEPYKPTAFPSLATSEISYPAEKLTLDPKNELCVDPRVTGLSGLDELSISYLVQKESYITQTSWNDTNPADTILFYSAITPFMFDLSQTFATNKQVAYYLSPMAWVGQMFNAWRGDIIIRMRIIASQYHKGRLRISYDPAAFSATNIINTANTTSAVITRIVDLSKDTSVTFRVPYSQAAPWCRTLKSLSYPATSYPFPWEDGSGLFPHVPNYTNGVFTVRVLNELTGPVTGTSVTLLFSFAGAENLEFANPGMDALSNSQFSYFAVQSTDEYDICSTELDAGKTVDQPFHERYLVNFGEAIPTLRSLLRRYCLSSYFFAASADATNDYNYNYFPMKRTPPQPGYDPSSPKLEAYGQVSPVPKTFNWNNFTYINWVMPAYVGYRGSFNWLFNTSNEGNPLPNIKVSRLPEAQLTSTTGYIGGTKYASNSPGTLRRFLLTNSTTSSGGAAITNQVTQAGVQVTIPNMSIMKFQSTDILDMAGTGTDYPPSYSGFEGVLLEVQTNNIISDRKNFNVQGYCAIGSDFNLHFFLNVPTVFQYAAVPTGY